MKVTAFGVAVAALLLLSACATGERAPGEPTSSPSVVRIAVADMPYPPFSFKNASGTWAGFDVDLSRAVCEVEQLTCETVAVPWEDLIQSLMERRVDALWTSMQTTPERREIIDFTNFYYESIHALIGPASSAAIPNMADPNSLKGKKIGVQTTTVSAAYVHQHFAGVAEVKLYDTLNDALADLKAGHLDYVSEFVTFLTPFLKENPSFVVKAISPLNPILNQGIAIGVRRGDGTLRTKLNEGIAAVIRNGTYDEILEKYPGLGEEIRKPQT
ncbi:MAG TPA: transporter substrate-binding domain-containing protein [Dongiaceae bacterium]|nr:transporter substrate-binding domain-containing protein [Dongiaceae bacterium]